MFKTLPHFIILAGAAALAATAAEPFGTWKTQDGSAVVQIAPDGAGRLQGWIIRGPAPEERDAQNPNPALRTKPILGLGILRDFVQESPLTWKNGHIYDPESGKEYKAVLWLDEGKPDRLNIKGYLGVTLFGRTEVWTRER